MKILAFAATNSLNSINKQLVSHAARVLEGGIVTDAEVEVIDINEYEMPLYGIDRQNEIGIPDLADKFYAKIADADALLISFAEHNGSLTVAYRNLFDWTSRIDRRVYQDKPAVYLATSPGPGGARSALGTAVDSAPHFGADVRADLSIPSFYENFDSETGSISNPEVQAQLEKALASLAVAA